ncbi:MULTISPECIES: glutamate decarboxylase [unclassified Lentimonas]|uniref:glutamate decarboxylase n=1 Tax=unclassified Lentimonas TaxID=2630993 RepID=UPI001326945A|nr:MULTISPECIES: glutamate decarboxylase [unclassified Lentimonas]CAA6676941.1 Glutamate decarboxylase (EC [Lentimonas sp. CC4]CAA6686747.1 Glutamate decarboxylase (EC [Lentimonas sp. CC6]CAA6692855.1 Glutamate decarboxylase (EC [Lentimonas sp. CC10]CAA6695559.1 Glutamate decarboxylase (EC [Lentimonas sp. CC19]CAA7069890.1 Glutamate decarboxylase (EC [Lentimonas sp. CC11]
MAIHDKKSIEGKIDDAVYASTNLSVSMPKFKFPNNEHSPRDAYTVVHDELMLDGNARQNLATFCQTWEEPEIHKLMDECIDKNIVDKDEYPQIAEIESRCVHMLADLWNSPAGANTVGTSTTGSSEAAMLGGMAMLRRWEAKRKAEGKPYDKPNLVTGPVQICWHKFTRYWNIEHREIPMDDPRLIMTPEEALKRCDENTIGVVPTLGVTFTGEYEPVEAVSKALDQLQADTGLDIPIHVDGASGGFLAPFSAPELTWDFRLERVKSINASGHKFGLSPLGVGWAIWREESDLPEEMVFWVNYLGGNMRDIALNFSRPGGQVACQYYNFLRLGKEGYAKIHNACYDTAAYLATEIEKLGPFEIIYNGERDKGIPALCWKIKENTDPGFTLYDLADRLSMRGWQVPAYSLPANREELSIQRILVRHGVSRDLGDLLLKDMKQAMAHLEKHPSSTPMTGDEGSGFHH